jgi:hypothetical protein
MQHEPTNTSSSALLPVLIVRDDELHPVTRVCRSVPPPLPTADEALAVGEEDLHPITVAQWTH